MIDIPSNLTDGDSVYLGNKQFVYNGGKLVPYVVTTVGTELTSPKLNVETLTEKRHPISQKPIYLKTIDFGFLPNTTIKNVAHTITNYDYIGVNLEYSYIYIPGVSEFSYTGGLSVWNNKIYDIGSYIDGPNISLATGTNRTNMKAYITVEYTKTADTSSSPVKSLYTGSLNTGSLNELNLNQETHAGYKRNGKDVYQIEVDFGFLPNATTKSVPVPNILPTYAAWIDGSNSYIYAGDTYNEYYPVNMPSPTNLTYQIVCWVSPKTQSVNIMTGINRSDQTARVVINYTK